MKEEAEIKGYGVQNVTSSGITALLRSTTQKGPRQRQTDGVSFQEKMAIHQSKGNGSFGCLAFVLSGGASRIKVNERLLVHLEMKKSWFVSREH